MSTSVEFSVQRNFKVKISRAKGVIPCNLDQVQRTMYSVRRKIMGFYMIIFS